MGFILLNCKSYNVHDIEQIVLVHDIEQIVLVHDIEQIMLVNVLLLLFCQ